MPSSLAVLRSFFISPPMWDQVVGIPTLALPVVCLFRFFCFLRLSTRRHHLTILPKSRVLASGLRISVPLLGSWEVGVLILPLLALFLNRFRNFIFAIESRHDWTRSTLDWVTV